jgi:hypothetical protein
MSTLYGYPELGRYGLGHSLLAWARCHIWCQAHQATMLGPIWLRPRIGPYLRRERDKREYFKLFDNAGYAGEPLRSWLLLTARKVPADQLPAANAAPDNATRAQVVVFRNALASNFETHFHEVKGHGRTLHRALTAITRTAYRPRPYSESPFIALHVRLGDFSAFDPSHVAQGQHNRRLPIDWYCEALNALRAALGSDMQATVFSDGDDSELTPLLAMPRVRRAPDGESVTHMLEMARARAIISTGSGFSLWSAFFGQMPRITYPQQRLVLVNDNPALEHAFASGSIIPDTIARAVTTVAAPTATSE